MSKWKCEICGVEFENFHAQGFDNKIYCPLCYFKRKNQELKKQLKELEEQSSNAINKQVARGIVLINQQKEFIEWLESEIKACELTYDLIFNHNKEMEIYKEILSKYKEIVGGK